VYVAYFKGTKYNFHTLQDVCTKKSGTWLGQSPRNPKSFYNFPKKYPKVPHFWNSWAGLGISCVSKIIIKIITVLFLPDQEGREELISFLIILRL
jgi:hypothetical protein